jgi:hypothetical protein
MKSKLNKQQKKYIKACDSKELRKELKRFLKKENKSFNNKLEKHIKQRDKTANKVLISGFVWEPLIVLDEAKREEFEKINGKGFPWYKESLKEVEKRFKEAAKKYMPNSNEKIKYEFVKSSNEKTDQIKEKLQRHCNNLALATSIVFPVSDKYKATETPNANIIKNFSHLLKEDIEPPHNNVNPPVRYSAEEIFTPFLKKSETSNSNTLTKEIIESLTNPDLIEKQKLIESIKLTYSQEDMFKCFQESRLTNPIAGFKFDSFACYLESLQK